MRLYLAVAIAFGLIVFVAWGGIAWATWVLLVLAHGHWMAGGCIAIVGLTFLLIAWQAVQGVLAWGER